MKFGMKQLAAVATLGVLSAGAMQLAAVEPATTPTAVTAGDKVLVATSFRASKLAGLNVRNDKGEKLGTVDDTVIDLKTGKVSYLALSFGTTLGLGGKLFAVPYDQVQFDHGKEEMFFVLNVPKEKLEQAPGFDKSNWPNFADPHWSEQVDKYYLKSTHTGTK